MSNEKQIIRSKKELAAYYEIHTRKLRIWVLRTKLFTPKQYTAVKEFTPKQIKSIINELGEA